jgi:hypothetical protein
MSKRLLIAVFDALLGSCMNCGADPPVRAGPPGPALCQGHQSHPATNRPTGASAADQGVRPTIYADVRLLGKLSGIGLIACQFAGHRPAPPA